MAIQQRSHQHHHILPLFPVAKIIDHRQHPHHSHRRPPPPHPCRRFPPPVSGEASTGADLLTLSFSRAHTTTVVSLLLQPQTPSPFLSHLPVTTPAFLATAFSLPATSTSLRSLLPSPTTTETDTTTTTFFPLFIPNHGRVTVLPPAPPALFPPPCFQTQATTTEFLLPFTFSISFYYY
ncbi:hypothetical protein RND81_12G043200 [Saponaria officinalis]|uniref:Uncharacterized protein n=1 Tax=Saponaria officinalis TaxID=3572 RepID=A0AAW1H4V7_SAPOF